MKTIALFNPASGSVNADGGEKLREALEAAGVRGPDMVEADREDCEGQLKRLAASALDLFVVWGGDGTCARRWAWWARRHRTFSCCLVGP